MPKDSTFMKILCFPSISRKLYSHPWKTLPDVFCAKCDTWVEKAARVLRILMEGIKNKVLTKNNYLIPSLPQVVLAYSSTCFGICQRQHLPGGEDYNNYWGFNPELGKREVHPTCQMKRLIIVRAARRRTPVLATCHHHNNYHHDYHVIMVNSPQKGSRYCSQFHQPTCCCEVRRGTCLQVLQPFWGVHFLQLFLPQKHLRLGSITYGP